jgi:hypothetical protein
VGDLVEARRDIALQRPLITVWCASERADLRDRVVSAPLGPKPVGARQEVRLPDGFQDQFQRGLHDTISHGRDAQPTQLAARFRNHPFADRQRAERLRLHLDPEVSQEGLHSVTLFDVEGAGSVHTSRPGTPVAPHPVPRNKQERGHGQG